MENKKNNLLVILLTIIVIALGGFIIYDKFIVKEGNSNNVSSNTIDTTTKVEDVQKNDNTTIDKTNEESKKIDKDQILKEVSDVYSKLYDLYNFADDKTKDEGYFKNKYGQYFTENGIHEIYMASYPYDGSAIISTVFNGTDSGKKELSLIIADENTAVTTGLFKGYVAKDENGNVLETISSDRYYKYIVFKKIDGVWKIDMFE